MLKIGINLKNIIIDILIKIVKIVFPILTILYFLISMAYNNEIKKYENNILTNLSSKANIFEKNIQFFFKEVFQDIFIIENSSEFQDFIQQQNSKQKLELQGLFERYMENKEEFLQLRFIDSDGKEVIRVDRMNNTIFTIPDEKLQNKKDRYYFKDSIKLNRNEIYISNLDLNVEYGEIVDPYQPVIRFSSLVLDKDGNKIGILVINYNGEKFLNAFNNHFKETNNLIDFYLTDNSGYYLSNRNPMKNFGFMFKEEALDYTVKKEFPELWRLVTSFSEKKLEIKDQIFYFKKIIPKFKRDVHFKNEEFYWNVIFSIKNKDIPLMYPDIFLFKKNIKLYILLVALLIFSTIATILHIKKLESAQLHLAKLILSYVDEAVIITDSKKRIVDLNDGFIRLTGYSKKELLNLNIERFRDNLVNPELYEEIEKQAAERGQWDGDLWLRKKDSTKYPGNLNVKKIVNLKTKKPRYYFCIIKDLSFEKDKNNEIEYLLTHHSKTKLPNEILFFKLIEEEIAKKLKFSIIYIKLKNYETLQIKYNEGFLDLICKDIIEKLQTVVKEKEDIIHLSRDTFIAISKVANNRFLLNRSMNELANKLKSSLIIEGKSINLEFEFGAVIFPEHGNSSEDLFKKAIFSVKALKYYPDRNFIIYQDKFENKIKRELEIEEQLITAVKNNEFEIYFQPQIDSRTLLINGLEALIRWNSPVLGNVSPVEFIPIAEKIGIIHNIGMWVVENVARLTKELELDKYKNIKISINLSASEFKDEFLVENIVYVLESFDLDFKQFEIELTEGVLVNNYADVKSKLDEFHMNGITIAIDDFGTGFSSMSYLKKLKFDKIKIDRSFIKDYPRLDDGAIAEVIAYLAKKLNVKVIAEGVETAEQVAYLQSIGCNNIQGYYYSKPLSSEELKKYIDEYINSKAATLK